MDTKIPTWHLFLVSFITLIYLLLSDLFIPLSFVLLPFALYFLVRLKLTSSYYFWITFTSFFLPIAYFGSSSLWIIFVVLYVVTVVVTYTIKNNVSQEVTYFYVTSALVLSSLALISLFQYLGLIQPIDERFFNFQNWYFAEVERSGSLETFGIDGEVLQQSFEMILLNLPAYYTVLMIFVSIYTIVVLRLLLETSRIQLWPFKHLHQWRMPRFTLLLFFILFIMSLFINVESNGYSIVSNGMFILQWMFYIHGISFILYFLMQNMRQLLAILITIPMVFFFPVTMILGVMELVFKFRDKIDSKRK